MYNRYFLIRSLALLVFSSLLAATSYAQDNNQPPEGFRAIWDGETFEGWGAGETKDPEWFWTLDYDTWHNYRVEMEEKAMKHWRIQDGVLISDGKGPHLVSDRYYGDMEMWVDWKLMTAGGDSGIYLRHCPQVQIWDPNHKPAHKHGSDKGSGGLWNNAKGTVGKDPSQLADNPIGEWNRMYIRMVGPYVKVVLNGKTVVNNVVMENFFHRDQPVYQDGPIHLQTHGSETRFKNIFVRRIPYSEADEILGEIMGEDEDEFTPLFNGKDLAGWIGASDAYEVKNGAIVCKQDLGGNLLTEKQYEDFVVRLQFKTPPGGNSGLAIRMPTDDPKVYPTEVALELQVLDDNHIMYAKLREDQYHGSAYGIKGAHKGFLRPACQWNTQEVTVQGDHVTVVLNGYKVLETHLKKDAPDDHPAKSDSFVKGHFGISGHFDQVQFRDIRIKELKSD
ncbi:MAG: DUF1080 domain-containing protein [Planctomycetota bacterium]